MLKRYLTTKINALQRWLDHPDRADHDFEAQEQMAELEARYREVEVIRALRKISSMALLQSGVRLQFLALGVVVFADFDAGRELTENTIQAQDLDGVNLFTYTYSGLGIDQLSNALETRLLAQYRSQDEMQAAAAR